MDLGHRLSLAWELENDDIIDSLHAEDETDSDISYEPDFEALLEDMANNY